LRRKKQLTRIRNVRQTTKFKRSIKAISPVIATLLMIAIAVVASLVVYAWVTGYMGNTTSKAGKAIQIQSYAISGGNLVVYVQNVGQGDVALNKDQSVYVDSKLVPITLPATATIPINAQDTVELTLPLPSDYVQGHSLNIKVTTTDGTFMTATGIPKTTNPTTPATTYAVNFVLGSGGLSMNPAAGAQNVGGTIAISATENTGHHFTSWSSTGSITFADANLASTTATVNGAGSITANFAVDTVQYSVTFAMSGDAGAVISPTAGAHSYDAGSSVPIIATASSGYHFTSWSSSTGSITFNDANLASTSATINDAGTVTANFAVDAPQTVAITVTSSTTGTGFVTVDSTAYTTPHTFDWTPGSSHTIAAISPVTEGSTRYVYTSWSDSGAQSHSYTVPSSSATVTANYKTQYKVTFAVNQVGLGTITTPSTSPQWYDADQSSISIVASPSGTNTFYSWTCSPIGQVTFGSATTASTTMNIDASASGAITVTANFATTVTIRPNANGVTNLNGQGTATSNWDRVDDTTSDGTSTYVRGTSDNNWQYDTYNILDQTLTGKITNVGIYIRCEKDNTDNTGVVARTAASISGGSVQYGTSTSELTTSWADYHTDYSTKSGTLGSGSWTFTDINNLQIGVSLTSQNTYYSHNDHWTYAMCTQVYVVVTYVPGLS
jgi:flagellin-like protein